MAAGGDSFGAAADERRAPSVRVMVATDRIGSMSSAQAGAAIGLGWVQAEVTVVPVGEAGAGFGRARCDQIGANLTSVLVGSAGVEYGRTDQELVIAYEDTSARTPGVPYAASSFGLGLALRQALAREPVERVVVDLAGLDVHDAGAGFLAALGASADGPLDRGGAGLTAVTAADMDLSPRLLAGVQLIGVVPPAQLTQPLLGLRGITSLRGRATGEDAAVLLATDAALETFARSVAGDAADRAGAGACGGLGLAIFALGGRLSTGPALAFEADPVRGAAAEAELMVTGCSVFDFGSRGGGVVAEAATRAAAALCPCIAIAGEVLIGGREMRTMGIEAAYAVRESSLDRPTGGDVTEPELAAVAQRIARSWRW